MNSKIIAGTCILSLAFTLCACGPINETYEQVEFTETTTAETTASTTTALTGSTTAVSSNASTVTTLNTIGALTSVTDGSTAVGNVTAETEAEKQQDNVQDNMQDDVVTEQSQESIEIKVEDTKYNESNGETPTTQAVTTATTETAVITTVETTPTVTETEAVVTEEYVVYKPSTKYAHRSTCRWNKDDAYRCDDFSQLETRICTECNPEIGAHIEYQAPTGDSGDKDSMSYVKHFSRGTYYCYGCEKYGGSGRYLYDCSYGNGNGIKGSIASSYIYNNYGYNYNNGRTTVYLEVTGYPSMSGYYFCDDCDAGNWNVIDFFYIYASNCPFQNQGVVEVDVWI